MYSNLRSVCDNYASLGVKRILLARAIEDRAELEQCRSSVSATHTVICRLTAGVEVMRQRVQGRELGVLQRDYAARVAKLNVILDRARLEDFTVTSDNRPPTEIALEMLVKARWIPN